MPMKDADGRVIQWFGTNTDITERQEAEEALRRATSAWTCWRRSPALLASASPQKGWMPCA